MSCHRHFPLRISDDALTFHGRFRFIHAVWAFLFSCEYSELLFDFTQRHKGASEAVRILLGAFGWMVACSAAEPPDRLGKALTISCIVRLF